MKTLQNNFTTPEQSKRLLELGVPADSADCWLTMSDEIFEDRHRPHVRTRGYETANSFFELRAESIIPCWSFGRLMEILCVCTESRAIEGLKIKDLAAYYRNAENVCDKCIEDIELLIKDKAFDFSKLED